MTIPVADDPDAKGLAADRLRDIESLTDTALSRLDEQGLLNALVERVKKVLRADTAAVLLLDERAGQLVATAASGIEEEVRQGVRIPLGTGFAGRVAASREPVILATVDHTTVRNPLLIDRGIRSLLGVPLLVGGKVIGVLHVGSLSGRPFGQQDVELLQLAADRAALALRSLMSQDDALAAVALQRSLLPMALPALPGLGLAARYVTGSGAVGGDWYDVFSCRTGDSPSWWETWRDQGWRPRSSWAGCAARCAPTYCRRQTPPPRCACWTARSSISSRTRWPPCFTACTPRRPASSPFLSAGHLPPVLAAPGGQSGLLPVHPDPPIGTADDPQRRSATIFIPPGALLCCFTDGLVERRGQVLDQGMDRLAAVLAKVIAAGPDGMTKPVEEDACAEIMRALVGNTLPRTTSPSSCSAGLLAPWRRKCGPDFRYFGRKDGPLAGARAGRKRETPSV